MTASMATASGSALVLYMSMGINAKYLIAASLMSGLNGIILSKMMLPETEHDRIQRDVHLVRDDATSLFDAIERGVMHGARIAVGVVVMVMFAIAFMAMANAGFNAILSTFHVQAQLQDVLGWPFAPLAYLMGVPWHDAVLSGRLIATELLFNEVVSYHDLVQAISTSGGMLAERTQMILTCALCGFAHLGSIGIQIGGLGAMAPERRGEIAGVAFKAMIIANMATWLTAAICGLIF
jgi:CNT family concentrative nucleoside transporter